MSKSAKAFSETESRVSVETVGLSNFDAAALAHVVAGADFEHRRLLGGGPDIRLLQCALPRSVLNLGDYSPAVLVNGTFARDTITLGTMLRQQQKTVVNSIEVDSGTIQFYTEHAELCYRAWPEGMWFAISIERECLETFCREHFDAGPLVSATARGVTHFSPLSEMAGQQMLIELRDLDQSLPALADTADPARLGQAVEHDLLTRLSGVLCRKSPTHAPHRGERRKVLRCREMLRHAMALVEADPGETLDLQTMAKATGLSPRTLQRTFQSACGMSPHEWFRVERLHRVRDDLLHARNGGSVTRSATRWGFFHLGRFSRHYHNLFGESPRDTVRRARATLTDEIEPRPGKT